MRGRWTNELDQNLLQADGPIHYDITSYFDLLSLANTLHARTRLGIQVSVYVYSNETKFLRHQKDVLSMITRIVVRPRHPGRPLLQHCSFSAEGPVSVSCVPVYPPRNLHW
jgi:hypothetical protein